MRTITRLVLLVFLSVMPIAHSLAAKSVTTNPDAAWKAYGKNESTLPPSLKFPHASCFKAAAVQYDLPETLLLAIARGESDFVTTARSKANAHGVMQILWPGTANHLGIYRLSELYDACTNIDAGARYFKELLARFNGNIHLALAAYNYGPERIAKNEANIPDGARWYSDYIYRHLTYVLGDKNAGTSASEHLYSEMGRTVLVRFSEPYRAAAFVEGLEQRSPSLELDWFRKDVGNFAVVLIYEDKEQYLRSTKLLANAGFSLN